MAGIQVGRRAIIRLQVLSARGPRGLLRAAAVSCAVGALERRRRFRLQAPTALCRARGEPPTFSDIESTSNSNQYQ